MISCFCGYFFFLSVNVFAQERLPAPKKGQIFPHEAMFYEKLAKENVHCLLCPRSCTIAPNQLGTCRVRENKKGKLYTNAFDNPCAVHIDPIEKKPFFHFLPGSLSLSLATAGCNVRCVFCQNWDIAQISPKESTNFLLTAKDIARLAEKTGCATVAYTYTEPTTAFEFVLECASETRKAGVRNVMHSNGYINDKPGLQLAKSIDAANIDLKGFSDGVYNELMSGAFLDPVLQTLKRLHQNGVWLEITNLIIPTKNDDLDTIKKMCQWIKENLGPDVPLHFSRFYPQYLLKNLPPTPIDTLEKARQIALDVGLHYVYIGNVPGHEAEDTFCPKCGKKVVDRTGYTIISFNITKSGRCKYCSTRIAGVWR